MSGFVYQCTFHSPEGPIMLTSPVNVTIAASNGGALKANTAASDHGGHREPPLLPHHQAQAEDAVIEPELPSNSPLTNVNAVTATVGNRTILQELTLNVATMLRIARRADENLTSLFLRIIATIEAMPQAERLQLEIRAGLKPLKITLADLVMALRKPDGPEAARLTATAEAPTAVPGRAAANAATTTYLEDGTDSGHTEETLAMRAAARNSAAGQSLFSAESKMRPADAQPTDAKVLQNHLKAMFEPGENKTAEQPEENALATAAAKDLPVSDDMPVSTELLLVEDLPVLEDLPVAKDLAKTKDLPTAGDRARSGDMNANPAKPQATPPKLPQSMPPGAASAGASAGETVTFSSSNLKLDPLTVEKIRNVAQSIADLADTVRAEQDHPTPEKVEDRRLQTMLTLKGLAEVVSAIPAKAAELLAAVVAEAAAPLPEPAEEVQSGAVEPLLQAFEEDQLPESSLTGDELVASDVAVVALTEDLPTEIAMDSSVSTNRVKAEAQAIAAEEHQTSPDPDALPPARQDLVQHAVPFTYAQVQPAREEMSLAVEEEETRGDADEDGQAEHDEDGERRRPRDEYDAIHDPVEEEDPAIVIDRDSSEADRAFALYQRMGGF